MRTQTSPDIESGIYDKVFSGDLECDELEEVYTLLNRPVTEWPESYKGRSMSVSDIVEIEDSALEENGFYFCNDIGFDKVSFDPSKAHEIEAGESIKVLLIEPGIPPEGTNIRSDLRSMQRVVGGYIEASFPFDDDVCIVCNDSGKINGMRENRGIYSPDGSTLIDVIYGPFFICGCRYGEFTSLSDSQIEKYGEKFRSPESLVKNIDDGSFSMKPLTENEFFEKEL